MRRFVTLLAFLLLIFNCVRMGSRLHAQSGPNPSTPGWLIPNTSDSGNTRWGWSAVTQTTPLPVQPSYLFNNITGQATATLKTGAGVLHTLTFNAPTATEVVTLFDNTAGSGTKIGTITVSASPQPVTLTYDLIFTTGLTVVTATASSDITVSFR